MTVTKIELDRSLIRELPVVYEGGEATAVLIDIKLFDLLLERLEELEDRELFSDCVIARLRKAREDHLAGRVTSHAELMIEMERVQVVSGARRPDVPIRPRMS
jgi:hypothetical protein